MAIRRDLLWILLLSGIVQAFWGVRLHHPAYFDAYYYTVGGQNLANGQGFTANVIWQYLNAPDGLPAPTFTYWMPLPALLAALGYKVTGTFRGAQAPFWLMATLMPLLSYLIAWRLSRRRWQAVTAALFTMAGGYYAAYWIQPSTFALFGFVGGLFLVVLAAAVEEQTAVYWAAAGALAGLGHLARADGLLLAGVAGMLWLNLFGQSVKIQRVKIKEQPVDSHQLSIIHSLMNLLVFGLGYLLVMGGWFWHTYQLIGRPLSTVGTQTIFLTQYNDVFSYGRSFTLADYLAWGWWNILQSKVKAVWLALQTFVAVTGLTAFSFFMVWGWIRYSGKQETKLFLRPFTWYTLLLYAVMSLVFTFPGQRGSLLHSSTALWPWSMALAVGGLDAAVDWIAARRRSWRPEQAKRIFAAAFVVMVWVISWAVSERLPLGDEEAAVYKQVAAMLPPDAVVMYGAPADFHYHTGLPAIATPAEPLPVVLQAADRYGAAYLLLDPDRPPPLDGLYEGTETNGRVVKIWEEDGYQLYRLDGDGS